MSSVRRPRARESEKSRKDLLAKIHCLYQVVTDAIHATGRVRIYSSKAKRSTKPSDPVGTNSILEELFTADAELRPSTSAFPGIQTSGAVQEGEAFIASLVEGMKGPELVSAIIRLTARGIAELSLSRGRIESRPLIEDEDIVYDKQNGLVLVKFKCAQHFDEPELHNGDFIDFDEDHLDLEQAEGAPKKKTKKKVKMKKKLRKKDRLETSSSAFVPASKRKTVEWRFAKACQYVRSINGKGFSQTALGRVSLERGKSCQTLTTETIRHSQPR